MNPIRLSASLLLTFSLAACAAFGSPPLLSPSSSTPEEMMRLGFEESGQVVLQASQRGNLLTVIQALEALEAKLAGEPAPRRVGLANDFARKLSEAGDYAGAHRVMAPHSKGPRTQGTPPAGYAPADAFEAIAKLADSVQVIMINEAHHVPQHRAFTLELMATLRQKGFTHFAAETLNFLDDVAKRGYPTEQTGPYIPEPLYGDLVRTALRLGYKVVPYESVRMGTPDQRESDQATHLIERTLRQDPKAKVLVLCGYGHNDESASPPWMAGRFHQMSGIDPLTVNQFWMTEAGAPDIEEPAYRWATERGLVPRPVAFRDAGGAFWKPKEGFDLVVFHPRSQYENGRPAWLRMRGLRSPHLLPDTICGKAPRCLVRARLASEGPDAVPIDQVIVTSGKPAPALLLPKGDFTVRVEGADGTVIDQRVVRMP